MFNGNQNLVDHIKAHAALGTVDTAGMISYVMSVINALDPQESVIDFVTAPPALPTTGDRYIIIAPATGTFTGEEDKITEYNGSSWDLVTPDEGTGAWIESLNKAYIYNAAYPGGSWIDIGTFISHSILLNLSADDHTQYALLAGRAGGQTLKGGTANSENLTLQSTVAATKGSIIVDSLLTMIGTDPLALGTTATTSHALGAGNVITGGSLEVDGILYADATAQIATLNITDGNLITPVGVALTIAAGNDVINTDDVIKGLTGRLNLGKIGSDSHSLTTDDVYIGNALEVDGISYFDNKVVQTATLDAATGDEAALQLNVEVDKLTSGNSYLIRGILADTSTPNYQYAFYFSRTADSLFSYELQTGVMALVPYSNVLDPYITTSPYMDIGFKPTQLASNIRSSLETYTENAHLIGDDTSSPRKTTCTSNGTAVITKTTHGLDTNYGIGDMLQVCAGSTAADIGYYRITAIDANTITLDRALVGSDADVTIQPYKDSIGMFATDGVNGQIITGYSHQNKPLQLGGSTYQATASGLTAEDILVAGKLETSAKLDADTGDEYGMYLGYEVNKLTSGADYGLYIKQTDTSSPGNSYPLAIYSGGSLRWRFGFDGQIYGGTGGGSQSIVLTSLGGRDVGIETTNSISGVNAIINLINYKVNSFLVGNGAANQFRNVQTAFTSNGTAILTKATHGVDTHTAIGDLLCIVDSSTVADEGYYRVVAIDANTITVDRTLAGSDADVDLITYKDVIASFGTDGTNGQIISGFSHQDKPLQLGGNWHTATTRSLTGKDILVANNLEVDGNVYADADVIHNGLTISQDTLQTTDSADNVVSTVTLADESAYYIEIKVLAKESGSTDRNVYHLSGLFYRDGGNATQQGATTSITTIESDAAWACDFSLSGNDVRVYGNGNGDTVDWDCTIEVKELSD